MLILALGAFAAWNAWNWWQRDQSFKAGAMFDELDRAVAAGDAERAGRVFADLKQRFPGTSFAQQGGLAAAKVQFDKGQADAAKASLTWVAGNASEDEYRTVARLRLAALLTHSEYVFLTDDSGVGDSHEEPHIPCYHVQRLDQLMIRLVGAELAGHRIEADASQIIRTVGTPVNGVCTTGE